MEFETVIPEDMAEVIRKFEVIPQRVTGKKKVKNKVWIVLLSALIVQGCDRLGRNTNPRPIP